MMIAESVVLLAILFGLSFLFNRKIKRLTDRKQVAARQGEPDEAGNPGGVNSLSPAGRQRMKASSAGKKGTLPGNGTDVKQEAKPIDRINKANPKAVASMVTHWVDQQ